MIPIQARIAVAIVSLVLSFTLGWLVKGWQVDANALNAYENAVKKGNELGAKLEGTLQKLEANKFIVKEELRHETVKQVYSECILPVNGIRLFNQSASGNSSEP